MILLILAIGFWMMWMGNKKEVITPSEEEAAVSSTIVSPTPSLVSKTIVLEQTGLSGQSGMAEFVAVGDKTKVTLSMIGTKYPSPQPSHIHVGKCPNTGVVKYPLNKVINGKAETVISVSMEDLFADLPLAVNVHESDERVAVSTACGDLR